MGGFGAWGFRDLRFCFYLFYLCFFFFCFSFFFLGFIIGFLREGVHGGVGTWGTLGKLVVGFWVLCLSFLREVWGLGFAGFRFFGVCVVFCWVFGFFLGFYFS